MLRSSRSLEYVACTADFARAHPEYRVQVMVEARKAASVVYSPTGLVVARTDRWAQWQAAQWYPRGASANTRLCFKGSKATYTILDSALAITPEVDYKPADLFTQPLRRFCPRLGTDCVYLSNFTVACWVTRR